MEILNLKSTITEIKISLAGLDGKFKLTEKKKSKNLDQYRCCNPKNRNLFSYREVRIQKSKC